MDFRTTFKLNQLSPTTYTTLHLPERMGNPLPIAYGGFALGLAAKSSALSVPPSYRLYSLVGQYLGPASTTQPLKSTIRQIRQTRTFATRLVEVSQITDGGEERLVLVALADFMVPDEESLLVYSRPPSKKYSHHSALLSGPEQRQKAVDEGRAEQKVKDGFEISFALMARFFDIKPCPEGIFAQNLNGVMKHLPTSQDDLPTAEKSTADWVRSVKPLPDHAENIAALAFLMDGAMGFAALGFEHMFLEDSGAASSLDFALRVFTQDVDMAQWHLKELMTSVGNVGRTYVEAKLWDDEGKCVASLTEQSILRPKKEAKSVKEKL